MFLALREIRHEPARFALIVAVIALVAYVTFFLAALAVGLAHSYRAAVDSWDADAVVLTDASNENVSASRLSDEQVQQADDDVAATGDATVSALIAQAAVAELTDADGTAEPAPDADPGTDSEDDQLKSDVYAFGIDLDGALAPEVTEGRAISDPDSEVLLDDSLLEDGWALGDHLELAGTDHVWTVVGLTHDDTFQAAGVVTVDADALQEVGAEALAPSVNALVITGADWDDDAPASLTSSMSDGGLTLLTPGAFIKTLSGYSAQVLTFSLMIGSLVLIAALVLGIFLYVLTLQKRPVLGILKARGVPTRYLIGSGGAQTTILAAAGVLIGLALTLLTGLVLPDAVPFRLSPALDAGITTAFILVAVLGGLISVRVVARIDPVEAIS
ncbi:ABC transporter permease [Actinomyces radicidentis]|uniref:ABC transporter permease n=1 Tax=Actinomyces radicidentis TaxID=111015 RepID=UPI0026DFD517|nr:ABC transporter permease [Actinomyces radicidentis]